MSDREDRWALPHSCCGSWMPLKADFPPGTVVAIDPGCLREVVQQQGWRSLPVRPQLEDDLGLVAVGLLPAALCGIDIRASSTGKSARRVCDRRPPTMHWCAGSPVASALRCPNVVHFAYGDRMVTLGDWFASLWAESLGKRFDLDETRF